jgi:hypothetical protein
MSTPPDDLTAFARALADVPPHPGRLDRDALLFAAGRAAGRRWPLRLAAAATAILTAVSAALGVALVTRPPALVVDERVGRVPTPAPAESPRSEPGPIPEETSAPAAAALAEGLRLRRQDLRDDVRPAPQAPWASSSAGRSSDDVPDLYSLRLNAPHSDEEPPQ